MKRGDTASALLTIVLMLSGMTTAKTPPKKAHAASQPVITASSVWWKVSHTKQWRE